MNINFENLLVRLGQGIEPWSTDHEVNTLTTDHVPVAHRPVVTRLITHLVLYLPYTPFPCPFLAKLHSCVFILLLSQLRQKYNK